MPMTLRHTSGGQSFTALDELDIRARVEELKLLQVGWLNGDGVPPPHEGLDWLAEGFDCEDVDGIKLPYLFPTPEGHVRAEWAIASWSASMEIDLASKQADWHALNLETDEEVTETLDLAQPTGWQWLAKQIRNSGGEVE
jgi:hypothetical protein